MKKIKFTAGLTTCALAIFIVLCALPLPIVLLQLYWLGLTGCLIWMVICILKNGKPSQHTFDERFYEDADLGPHSSPRR